MLMMNRINYIIAHMFESATPRFTTTVREQLSERLQPYPEYPSQKGHKTKPED